MVIYNPKNHDNHPHEWKRNKQQKLKLSPELMTFVLIHLRFPKAFLNPCLPVQMGKHSPAIDNELAQNVKQHRILAAIIDEC